MGQHVPNFANPARIEKYMQGGIGKVRVFSDSPDCKFPIFHRRWSSKNTIGIDARGTSARTMLRRHFSDSSQDYFDKE